MAPKPKGKAEPEEAGSLVDSIFPRWNDGTSAADKSSDPYEDIDGQVFPDHTRHWLDQWRRPSEMDGASSCSMLELESILVNGKPTLGGASGRVFKGALYFGHPNFEWMLGQFLLVQQVQAQIPKGQYLFELIHPQVNGGTSISASGNYVVKLFILDTWRSVTVDDRIPLDLFGRPLFIASRPLQIWPMILCKALLKVMAAYQLIECMASHQAPVFTMLTSWPMEDLVSPLNGINPSNGELFDTLEAAVRDHAQASGRQRITCAHLRKRSQPKRPPPRVLVFSGPPGAGKRAVMAGLVAAHPDLFARVVTHTTRRPREHEVEGVDYCFTDAPQIRQMQQADQLLELSRIETVHGGGALYGISCAAIRSVASGGKVCLIALDTEGAVTLSNDDRIEAAFAYVVPPSLAEVEHRLRARLKEATSTISKRVEWAQGQMAAVDADAAAAGVDCVVENGDDEREVFMALKEAAAALSPIVRNRLHGIPQYILEYADLVVSNAVERPFLKPILVAGPAAGDKSTLLQTLADEFPDVFAFPTVITDEPAAPPADPGDGRQVLRGMSCRTPPGQSSRPTLTPGAGLDLPRAFQDDLLAPAPELAPEAPADIIEQNLPRHTVFEPRVDLMPRPGSDDGSAGRASAGGETSACAQAGSGGAAAGGGPDASGAALPAAALADAAVKSALAALPRQTPPEPHRVSREEFDAMVAKGEFIASHTTLFRHERVRCRIGYRKEELQEIMGAGKIPLLDVETIEIMQQFRKAGTDCLCAFLRPVSLEAYTARVHTWLSETDLAISRYIVDARAQAQDITQAGIYDFALENRKLNEAVEGALGWAKSLRPDLFKDVSTGEDDPFAKEPWRACRAVCLAGHPSLSITPALLQRLIECMPAEFAPLPESTTRKAAKEEVEGVHGFFGCKAADLEQARSAGGVLSWRQEGADVYARTLAAAAALYEATGKIAVVPVSDTEGVTRAEAGVPREMFLVHITPSEAVRGARAIAAYPESPEDGTAAAAAAAEATDNLRISRVPTVIDDHPVLATLALREVLGGHLRHHMEPGSPPLVIAGPFGTGKRLLLQRMLTLYPDGFQLAPVYTTAMVDGGGGPLRHVDAAFLADLEAQGLTAFRMDAVGHPYVVSRADICDIAARGKACLIDAESIEVVRDMHARRVRACFVHLRPPSDAVLRSLVHSQLGVEPPLGYDGPQAEALFYEHVQSELAAADALAAEGLWDADITLPEDPDAAYYSLMEAVADRFRSVVPPNHVWGFGRQLWDPAARVHGRRPLCVLLLGPAAVGKTSVAARIAERFGLLHINAGNLLFDEARKGTALGKLAKKYLHASALVPDAIFNELVSARLGQPDVLQLGYVLDGYPHTKAQVDFLTGKDLMPDKVLFMTATRAELLERVKWRRVDCDQGHEPFHMPPPAPEAPAKGAKGAPPPAAAVHEAPILPLTAEGAVDEERAARLQPRHDDSQENVLHRLELWDLYCEQLRVLYRDVSCTLSGTAPVSDTVDAAAAFISTEHRHASITPVLSRTLEDLTYAVVGTLKLRQQPLVCVRQGDGETFWVPLCDLAGNALCMNLHTSPAAFAHSAAVTHLLPVRPPPRPLLVIDTPEPAELLVGYAVGPVHGVWREAAPPPRLLAVSGAAGVGKSALVRELRASVGPRLVFPPVTATAPRPWATAHAPEFVVPDAAFDSLVSRKLLVYHAELPWREAVVRWGVLKADMVEAAKDARAVYAVVEEHPAGAAAVRAAVPDAVIMHVDVPDVDTLDQRLRMSEKQYEEQQVTDFLAEIATHRPLIAAAAPDVHVPNACMRLAHAAARAFLSASWPLRPHAAACQANVEAYTWAGRGPPATLRRLQHTCATASTLRLPRGRHVLRAVADPHTTHTLTVWSNCAFEFADKPELASASTGSELFFQEAVDEITPAAKGTWRVLCRHTFKLAKPARVAVQFRAAPVATNRSLRVLLVDNDRRSVTPLVLGTRPAKALPANERGFTIMVLQDAAAGDVPAGSYMLRLSSDAELLQFVPVPSGRVEPFEGAYAPNRCGEVWRFALAPLVPCQVAVRLQLRPPGLCGLLQLEADKGGAGGGKGAARKKGAVVSPPEEDGGVVFEASVAGDDVVPVIEVPPGRHVLTLALDQERSDLDVRPTGHIAACTEARPDSGSSEEAAGGACWRVVLAPTADDKACPIAADTSREAEQQAWLKDWVESRPGGLKERPRRGQEALGRYEQLLGQAAGAEEPVLERTVDGQALRVPAAAPARRALQAEVTALAPDVLLRERQGEAEGQRTSEAAVAEVRLEFTRASQAYQEVIDEGGRLVASHFENAALASAALKAQRDALQEQLVGAAAHGGRVGVEG